MAAPDGSPTAGSEAVPVSPTPSPQTVIRLLGPFELLCDGKPVVLRGGRYRRVLAFMALNAGTEVAIDSIVDLLWRDAPDSARQQVHNVVSHLRRAMADAGCQDIELVTGTVGYRLEVARTTVDAFRFETGIGEAERAYAAGRHENAIGLLREAVGLWRGPALAALTGDALEAAATRLNELRLIALERTAEIQLLLGDPQTPVRELPGLLAEHPHRESLRSLLMRALNRSGRQADALALYEEGRLLLADELGVDPGTLLRQTHQRILEGRDEPAPPESVAEPPAPVDRGGRSFLPRGIAEFSGRGTELESLTAELDRHAPDAPAVVVVDGMGGVGKTTFAVHLAHTVADRYPDGQYYLDLMGFSAGTHPLSPLTALSVLLQADGVPPESLPAGVEERSALWRSRLVGRKLLIFLDNAAEVGQTRPLLPGSPGILTLITTRRQMISLEGAVHLSLGVLAEDDAAELFAKIAGADLVAGQDEEVRAVVGLCGYLPLAIQIAAARLRARANWPVSYLVDQLLSLRGRTRLLASGDRDVMSILSWSFRHLTPVQQRGFRALGQHGGPDFDAYVLAALADLSVDEAETCADGLLEANLLQQHRPGRYFFHDLVRDCARIQLEESGTHEERGEAAERLADYFLYSANQWSITTSGSLPRIELGLAEPPAVFKEATDHTLAVAMFAADVQNIGATVLLAREFGLYSRIWRLIYVLMPYFHTQNYTGDCEDLLRLAVRSARESGSREGETLCLTGLAMVRLSQHRLGESRDLLLQALDLSQSDELAGAQIWQWVNLGAVSMAENDYAEARGCYLRGATIAQRIGDKHSEAYCTTNLGNLLLEAGELVEALEYFRGVEWMGLDTLPPRLGTSVLLNIGFTLLLQESDGDAASYFEAALAASRAAGDTGNEVFARIDLCAARRILGEFDESIRQGRAGLELAQALQIKDLESDARSALADVHLAGGDVDVASRIYQAAYDVAAEQGDARYVARGHEGLAHVSAARGDLDAAREHWRQSLRPAPGGVVHADGARGHLASPAGSTCWRCRSHY
jgi:DNA-binding SARP family transcriptional activator